MTGNPSTPDLPLDFFYGSYTVDSCGGGTDGFPAPSPDDTSIIDEQAGIIEGYLPSDPNGAPPNNNLLAIAPQPPARMPNLTLAQFITTCKLDGPPINMKYKSPVYTCTQFARTGMECAWINGARYAAMVRYTCDCKASIVTLRQQLLTVIQKVQGLLPTTQTRNELITEKKSLEYQLLRARTISQRPGHATFITSVSDGAGGETHYLFEPQDATFTPCQVNTTTVPPNYPSGAEIAASCGAAMCNRPGWKWNCQVPNIYHYLITKTWLNNATAVTSTLNLIYVPAAAGTPALTARQYLLNSKYSVFTDEDLGGVACLIAGKNCP